jgi:cystathionine gamma-synthase
VLNARRPHYTQLKAGMEAIFVDDYFPLDSVIMDYNSRDFESRISKINSNAETLCDILLSYPSVKRVYYPKCNPTREFYDKCRRASGGYGYLLTVLFHECTDAIRFLDALDVPKGPSLGTNFTLASPYTLLAHFWELEWVCVLQVFASPWPC